MNTSLMPIKRKREGKTFGVYHQNKPHTSSYTEVDLDDTHAPRRSRTTAHLADHTSDDSAAEDIDTLACAALTDQFTYMLRQTFNDMDYYPDHENNGADDGVHINVKNIKKTYDSTASCLNYLV
ncbi:hypothetical protein BDZ89DRAFT_1052940 [Hymenopellis radicata]|nr:hypothetical protein BDZ89DRAFT_1052940 [Hymenopellis radicata]